MRLPDYQKKIIGYHERLSTLFTPYTKAEDQEKSNSALARVLSNHAKKLKELSADAKPSIMLYGQYNAGKSTLLNAIMGKCAAEVKDVPTTYKIASYPWNGYELLDTPGIGAPVEHEKVSNEKLGDCHVITFVVSSDGSFEEGQIYRQMKYIIGKGKKLLIVLNNKSGLKPNVLEDQEEIVKIKNKILENLSTVGEIRSVADKYKVIVVNAKDALDGRLEKEERLELSSNIEELEADILKEIRRVNGFNIFHNALKNFVDDLDPKVEEFFSEADTSNERELNDEIRGINDEYWAFVKDARESVKEQCAGLTNAIFAVFPKEPTRNIDEALLQSSLTQAQEPYRQQAVDVVQNNLKRVYENISARISATFEKIASLEDIEGMPADDFLPELKADSDIAISKYENYQSSSVDVADIVSKGTKALMPLAPLIPPVPIPIPPVLVIQAVLGAISAIAKLFGESDAEKQKRETEAQAARIREAEERQERARVQWRQDIRGFCETRSDQIVINLQSALQKQIESVLTPLMESLKKKISEQKEDIKTLQTVIGNYYDIRGEIDATLEELRSRS